ncbi:hypothetical protein [Dysgonomonas sp. 37-18]|uniref:hypothetical protein n=1 Tax=Dysgonomonas sp. 37-18 TaxID=1895907 RepID=UPI0009262C00|nr:hypothetical protein [Dysgonomonas sp. 37-18]OJX64264.1 MAG: hypothetical protein BGO84_09375 [Dysgonomonas sp. 37-18]
MMLEIGGMSTLWIMLKSGHYTMKKSLDEIGFIPNVDYIILEKIITSLRSYTKYQYFIIDNHGNKINFKLGGFEIAYIDEDQISNQRFTSRFVEIYDTSKDKYYHYISKIGGISFFKEELIPLLEKLNELGSWEAYQIYIELEETKKKLQSLKKDYDELNDKYYALEETMNKEN